jgi:hypothetical protein
MSALPPKADMDWHGPDVRYVPKADIDGQPAKCATADRLRDPPPFPNAAFL